MKYFGKDFVAKEWVALVATMDFCYSLRGYGNSITPSIAQFIMLLLFFYIVRAAFPAQKTKQKLIDEPSFNSIKSSPPSSAEIDKIEFHKVDIEL